MFVLILLHGVFNMMFPSFVLWFLMSWSIIAPDCAAGYMIDVDACPTDTVMERNSKLTALADKENQQ